MSSHSKSARPAPFDLSKWRKAPTLLLAGGGVTVLIGALVSFLVIKDGGQHFAFSWLVAYMFCLSICLGALFLVLVHHLFDAGWSVPIRRMNEHLASMLFPWMAILWIPVGLLAPKLYAWMTRDPHADHFLHAKQPLFTMAGFYVTSAVCFLVWWFLSRGLRSWSIRQDEIGGAIPTYKMRSYSYWGIFAFAVTLTLAAVMWMKGMQHEWFSTMYGVVYFAGSVWMTLGLVYIITAVLDRQRVLTHVLHEHQFYFIGTLMFAFTVFYAYIHFAQYFIIWNANLPEETFWYLLREKGTWFLVGLIIIFGHFFMPFLALLRIDLKSVFPYIAAIGAWNWLMHFFDMSFQIKPVLYPNGFAWQWLWLDIGCLAFMLGLLAKVFLAKYASAAPYPLKDPRLIEAMGHFHPVPTQISGGEVGECEDIPDEPQTGAAK